MRTLISETIDSLVSVLVLEPEPNPTWIRRIQDVRTARDPEVLDALTQLERVPGLPAHLHRLVALAKQVITGKYSRDDFFVDVCRAAGQM